MVGTITMAKARAWTFEIQPSKSLYFKCFRISNGQISDPSIARVDFVSFQNKFSDEPLISFLSWLSPGLVPGQGLDIRLVKTRVVIFVSGQVSGAKLDPIWSCCSCLATSWVVNHGGTRIRKNKQWGSECKHTWKCMLAKLKSMSPFSHL